MQTLRVVTLAGDSEREADIAAMFAGEPSVELFMRCVDRVELLATMRAADLDAIVAVGAPGWFDAQSAQEAARSGIRVVGVADNAFEAELLTTRGAQVLEAGTEMGAIVRACREPRAAASAPVKVDAPQRAGDVIAVWGPKGSPGRTTIAIELACELANTGEEAVLVDADPYAGDMSQMLGIVEELPTVLWGATAAGGDGVASPDIIRQLRRVGDKGPLLLPGLPRAELWSEVSDFGYGNLIKLLAGGARFVVVDTGFCLEDVSHLGSSRSGRNRMARATLERADRLIAVCRADPVGLKNFIWAYESVREIVDEDRISIVLNRSYPSERREIDDLLESNTGKRSTVAVPDRPSDCRKALAQGGALFEVRPASDVCIHTRLLAERMGAKVRPRGLMARLAGRS